MRRFTTRDLQLLGIERFNYEKLASCRAQGVMNYIAILLALARDHGMSFKELADWLQSHYEERGYYKEWEIKNTKGNMSRLVSDFIFGRQLLYDTFEVELSDNDNYIVKNKMWYENDLPEAFFYFDVGLKDFMEYAKYLASANAARLGVKLAIEYADGYEIATFEPEAPVIYRQKQAADEGALREFFLQYWSAPIMVSGGKVRDLTTCETILAEQNEQLQGVLTYEIQDTSCEIISIDAIKKHQGIGTGLLNKLIDVAKTRGCTRLWLVTTNDNLDAIRFYQRRGFSMTAIHRGAVDKAREIKPSIPYIGEYGIRISDEIEFEKMI